MFQRFYAGLREPDLRHPAQRQKIQAEANRVDIEDKDFLEKMLRFTEAEKQGARAVSREAARNPQGHPPAQERRPLKALEEQPEETPQDMQEWTQEEPPREIDQLRDVVKYVQMGGPLGGCFYCGEAGHISRHCPEKLAGKPQTEKGKEIQFAFSQKRHEQKRTGGFTHRAPPQGGGVYPSKAPEVQGKSMTTTQMLDYLSNRVSRLENQGGSDQADAGLQGEPPPKN